MSKYNNNLPSKIVIPVVDTPPIKMLLILLGRASAKFINSILNTRIEFTLKNGMFAGALLFIVAIAFLNSGDMYVETKAEIAATTFCPVEQPAPPTPEPILVVQEEPQVEDVVQNLKIVDPVENDAAPQTPPKTATGSVEQYIERFAPTAIQEMRKFGIPASISLAQGLIESRYGTSTLAVKNNNHFGIKCFSKKCRKGHCSNHSDDTHKDFFRIFETAWESWRHHSKMLSNGRYKRLHKFGKNYRKWAYGLENVGYATDRSYAEKLIGVIERYNLRKYDSGIIPAKKNAESKSKYTLTASN
ncbi:MAG TPA: glucosaminidase domain-containing protein [Cyclobacteriaceae bacterium]|nr:glucosaminidase domain-containing protein [Cyclobacteriaceae bacterium]